MSGDDPRDERGIPPYARGYESHPGRIGRTSADSDRAWPAERRAPEHAPNVIVVLLDDMGYSDIGPFGSEIPTPTLDRLAERGMRLTNYHTTPVCSPARAAALTGLNPHRAGFASVANSDPGFPNLRLELDEDVLTLPEILRHHGYATYAVGKWHLTRDALMHDAADKSTWPLQRGFDRYYGTLEGCNSFFHPNRLIRDNGPVEPPTRDGYYLTDDLTDQAIALIRGLRANDSRKPFFLYFAHVAMHGPLGAPEADLARHRGRYEAGWDRIREARHRRQLELGIVGPDVPLPPPEIAPQFQVPAWDDLSRDEQERFARYMEVYAAMVDNVDQNLGRLLGAVDELGELEDTIVVFTSDNGGTMEGGPEGTRSYFSRFVQIAGLPKDWEVDVDRDPDLIGGPRAMVHYPRGWGRVSNTPFRFYKGQTFAGGVRVPLVVSWPNGMARAEDDDGIRDQYQYVTDLTPTILDLLGLEAPPARAGLPAKEVDGSSFAPVLRDPASPSTHPEQYAEFGGNRGFYRDGWKLVTNHRPGTPFDDGEWELYHVASDPTELRNVADEHPERVRELAAAWERAAWENTVFPLVDSGLDPVRRPAERELERTVRIVPGTPRLERYRASRLVTLRDFVVDADVEHVAGASGVLFAHGDQGGGYLAWIEDDHVRLGYNEYGRLHVVEGPRLEPGPRAVRLRATALPEFAWRIELEVDGTIVGGLDRVAMLVGMAPFSGIDVGSDRGGPVHWDLHVRHGSFPYSGTLHSVTWHPGAHAAYDPAVVAVAEAEVAMAYD